MSFIWPVMLLFLLIIPLLVGLYLRLQQRRRQLIAQYGNFGIVRGAGRELGVRRHIPPALFLLGLAILLLSLARPQTVVSLPRVAGTVILAFDVSGSMAATDVEPTRMDAAKAVAREFVQRQPPTVQVGVVAFSEGGFAIQTPTDDQAAILAAIERIAPQQGTSLGQGIFAALTTLVPGVQPPDPANPNPTPLPQGSNPATAVLLLSDGENTGPPDPLEAAQVAADLGVRIYPVGIGSAAGTTIEIDGFSIHTQLDEAALQQIAQISNGAYFNGTSQQDLSAVYESIDLQLVMEEEATEITALLAGTGLLILLIGGVCSLLWFSRVP